ncbi:MAG: putative toxin-antitoxin system toxin component, PIN family [Chloroflexi bacterium]|nr:MAG: putative toxin-antitoxin system toxin component, PIN family [Chloroflexota bacterium]
MKSVRNVVLRAVVDTNIWISALLFPSGMPGKVLLALAERAFTLVISEPLLAEIEDVGQRPRITRKYGIVQKDIDRLIGLLRERAEVIPITGELRVCRDADDDMVIETALLGLADVLVTRDDDLKEASEVMIYLESAGISVLSVRRFLEALELS